jgi:hypothetical protein
MRECRRPLVGQLNRMLKIAPPNVTGRNPRGPRCMPAHAFCDLPMTSSIRDMRAQIMNPTETAIRRAFAAYLCPEPSESATTRTHAHDQSSSKSRGSAAPPRQSTALRIDCPTLSQEDGAWMASCCRASSATYVRPAVWRSPQLRPHFRETPRDEDRWQAGRKSHRRYVLDSRAGWWAAPKSVTSFAYPDRLKLVLEKTWTFGLT